MSSLLRLTVRSSSTLVFQYFVVTDSKRLFLLNLRLEEAADVLQTLKYSIIYVIKLIFHSFEVIFEQMAHW